MESTFSNIGITDRYRGRRYQYKNFATYVEFYVEVYRIVGQDNEGVLRKTLSAVTFVSFDNAAIRGVQCALRWFIRS